MPGSALAEGAVRDVNPTTTAFHQADGVFGVAVKTATWTSVLEPLHLTGWMAVRIRWLTEGLIMTMMTTAKEDITNKGFLHQRG